jgi:PAS domain S-box-containing protein
MKRLFHLLWPVAGERRIIGLVMAAWIALVGSSLLIRWRDENREVFDLAVVETRANYNKDLVYRRWSAMHGGVYVPPTDQSPPNPYLAHIPDRDVVTTGGRRLTLVNPAYMTRQVHELGERQYGARGHITSLNPIRPENGADPWETQALKAFQAGRTGEISSVEIMDGQPFLRFMNPLITEEGCLKCHAAQGYREGDIRGGISVSVPLAPYLDIAGGQKRRLLYNHGIIGLLGVLGIWFAGRLIVRSRRELQSERNQLMSIFDAIDEIIYISDPVTHELLYVNKATKKAFPKDPVGGICYREFQGLDGPCDFCTNQIILNRKPEAYRWEYHNPILNRDYSITDRIIKWSDGRDVRLGLAIDITARKQVERALTEERNKFVTGPTMVFKWRAEQGWPVSYASENVLQLLGYSAKDLMAGEPAYANLIHRDDLVRVAEEVHRHTQAGDERFEHQPYRVKCGDGRYIWVADYTTILRDRSGKETDYQGYVVNITRQHESDERLGLAIKGTQAGLWDWHVPTRKTVFNERWAEIVGYTLDELAPTSIRTWMDLCHPDDLIQSNHLLEKHFNGETDFYRCETRIRHKNGAWVWVLDSGKVVERDDDGNPVRVTGTHVDITERLEMERRKNQIEKTESVSRMAGAVAHNFNNMLAAVIGNLELAMEDLPPETAVTGFITQAKQAAQRAAETSGLMLTFLGQSLVKPKPVDLSASCKPRLDQLLPKMPERITLKTDLPISGPVVEADPDAIGQMLTHLAANAWEAMESTPGEVGVTIASVEAAGIPEHNRFPVDWSPSEDTYACLIISDTGRGMQADAIGKIFDPFFTDKSTGRGLGLAVVLGIVKSFQGCITVESHPGKGSTFRAFLPQSKETVPSPERKKAPEQPTGLGGNTVLLVEDEEIVRKVARAMLERLGYDVLEAADGEEAVKIFKKQRDRIHLVLSDLTMPHLDGWQVLAALRRIQPGIPVVLASGYDQAHAMAGNHPEQPQVFLHKPYGMKTLEEALQKALARASGSLDGRESGAQDE